MRALASAVLEPRGRKYLFAPAIIVKSISWLHTFCIAGELTWRTRHAPKLLAAPLGSTPPGSLPDSTWWVGGLQAYPFSKNPTPPQPFELALPCPRNIDCSDATECEDLIFTLRPCKQLHANHSRLWCELLIWLLRVFSSESFSDRIVAVFAT